VNWVQIDIDEAVDGIDHLTTQKNVSGWRWQGSDERGKIGAPSRIASLVGEISD